MRIGIVCVWFCLQALLTRDPDIVPQACKVLHLALEHNEDVLARLYRTGRGQQHDRMCGVQVDCHACQATH